MKLSMLMNPAGGLRYHARALRYQNREWQPFRWSIGEWLLGWHPPESTLILVGPSAGYCLQPFLFERFQRVVCLEPDPVACFLLKRRLSRAQLERLPALEFIQVDHLVRHPERLPELLERTPNSAILFSNVVGQLRALLGVEDNQGREFAQIRQAGRQSIQKRSWASFHDRVSGYLRPVHEHPITTETRLTDQELLSELYDDLGPNLKPRQRELVDHLTEGLFPSDVPHSYFTWEIEPGRYHLIEAVAGIVERDAR
jgi:hypothetical protein